MQLASVGRLVVRPDKSGNCVIGNSDGGSLEYNAAHAYDPCASFSPVTVADSR